jgi:hypothetical protein
MSGSNGLDRRTFLGRLTLTAGAVVAGQFVSLSIARAARGKGSAAAAQQGAAAAAAAAEGDWHVDDICGHWPRYVHPIPFAQPQSATVVWEGVDPVDVAFLS